MITVIYSVNLKRVIYKTDIPRDASHNEYARLGMAVQQAANEGVNLAFANLKNVHLVGSSLRNVNLSNANLKGAYISYADLWHANLAFADLSGAHIERTSTLGANLTSAVFKFTQFRDVYMRNAFIEYANFYGVNLDDVNMYGVSGVNRYIKCLQMGPFPVAYTAEVLQIGCERHLISTWKTYTDDDISAICGASTLGLWKKHKQWLFDTIERFPAIPTDSVCVSSKLKSREQ